MCGACDEYDTDIEIKSPSQLKRILSKIRIAVEDGKIKYNNFESDRALIGHESFLELNIEGPLPDVIRYYFNCPSCGNVFGLMVETYHGQGGAWSKLGKLSP